jgi:hypothetical protein
LHLNETTLNRVKGLGMTEKGRKSEFLMAIGEKAETTHILHIVPTPLEYWLLTTFPRERWYRQWWLTAHAHMDQTVLYERLGQKFPTGLSELPELPEECSAEVSLLRSAPGIVPLPPDEPTAIEKAPKSGFSWRRRYDARACKADSVWRQLRTSFCAIGR